MAAMDSRRRGLPSFRRGGREWLKPSQGKPPEGGSRDPFATFPRSKDRGYLKNKEYSNAQKPRGSKPPKAAQAIRLSTFPGLKSLKTAAT